MAHSLFVKRTIPTLLSPEEDDEAYTSSTRFFTIDDRLDIESLVDRTPEGVLFDEMVAARKISDAAFRVAAHESRTALYEVLPPKIVVSVETSSSEVKVRFSLIYQNFVKKVHGRLYMEIHLVLNQSAQLDFGARIGVPYGGETHVTRRHGKPVQIPSWMFVTSVVALFVAIIDDALRSYRDDVRPFPGALTDSDSDRIGAVLPFMLSHAITTSAVRRAEASEGRRRGT